MKLCTDDGAVIGVEPARMLNTIWESSYCNRMVSLYGN